MSEVSTSLSLIFTSYEALPFLLVITDIILLLLGRILKLKDHILWLTTIVLLILSIYFIYLSTPSSLMPINGLYLSNISRYGLGIMLFLAIIILLLMPKNLALGRTIDAMILFMISLLGGMVIIASDNWASLIIGMQCLSLPILGLLALHNEPISLDASLRYLMMSALASAFMLLGIALLYKEVGHWHLAISGNPPITMALGLILIGWAIKLGLAPFHFWVSNVFAQANHFMLVYLATMAKIPLILFMLNHHDLFLNNSIITLIVMLLATLSLWVGNIMIIKEHNLKRFMGFFTIGHMGFLLMALLSRHYLAKTAIFIDILATTIALILIFISVKEDVNLKDLQGLYHKNPINALLLSIGLASLAGLPLTLGFMAKFLIITSGLFAHLWFIAINMAIFSLGSMFALIRFIFLLWQHEDIPKKPSPAKIAFALAGSLIILGIMPNIVMSLN